jgi:hypothetical protein
MSGEQFSVKDAVVWNLNNKQTEERTAQAFLRVSDDCSSLNLDHRLFLNINSGVQQFNN